MKKSITFVIVLLAAGAGYFVYNRSDAPAAAANTPVDRGRPRAVEAARAVAAGLAAAGSAAAASGQQGGVRLPMTVELATVKRGEMSEQITVVGNLIGAATIEATPKVNGRLEEVYVRLGDRVSRGQRIAKIEDSRDSRAAQAGRGLVGRLVGDDSPARRRYQVRPDQPRSLAQPVRAPAHPEADARRRRGPIPGRGGPARSGQGAVCAGTGAPRRAEDQPRATRWSRRR